MIVSPKAENLPFSLSVASLNGRPLMGVLGLDPLLESSVIGIEDALLVGQLPSEDGVAISEALRDVLVNQLGDFFRPEFLNRIDDVVVFRTLSRQHLRAIVDIQLGHLEQMLGDRRVKLELDDAAKDRLVELGYEPALGARPVKRAILKEIQDPLAETLLAGGCEDGATIRVTVDGESFEFSQRA